MGRWCAGREDSVQGGNIVCTCAGREDTVVCREGRWCKGMEYREYRWVKILIKDSLIQGTRTYEY